MIKHSIKNVISQQHRRWPMPLALFDRMFRSKLGKRLLSRYGQVCFQTAYHDFRMRDGNLDYWMSRESLYWHFWRQTDTTPEPLRELRLRIPALNDPNLTAAELGFGIGKNRYLHPNLFPFRRYIGIEPNPHCVDVARRRLPEVELICAESRSVEALEVDVLFVFGGVLMYQESADIDRMFRSFSRLKALVILDEGADTDWVREDRTTMYDFRSRLEAHGCAARNFHIEKQADRPINRVFAMW